MSAAATTLWARAFTDELARAGVRDVVVAPGSRSTPLVLAMAPDDRFRLRVHLDERSAAFFALGRGKATGRPAAVVTTSGTATANLLPAVVEAAQAETPLLLLTADRPPRLRGADANQAIDQVGLYGGYARASFETAQPTLDGAALRHLRGVACRAVAAAVGPPAGPVHVNLPFDKPLEPEEAEEADTLRAADPLAVDGRPGGRPFVSVRGGPARPPAAAVRELAGMLRAAGRPLVVAGPAPDPGRLGPAAIGLARALGAPLLADPLSGGRFAPGAEEVGVPAYDLLLRHEGVRARLAPDLVVRVGRSPTSAALQGWLVELSGTDHVVVDGGRHWKDHGAVATGYVPFDAAETLDAVVAALGPEGTPGPAQDGDGGGAAPRARAAWQAAWARVRDGVRAASREEGAPDDAREARIVPAVVDALRAGTTLFVSSSMPVRDLDALGGPSDEPITVLGNRGASGIDGVVSSAFGAAVGPTVCILGDLAFFHDQNGLLFARDQDEPVVFVLVDNDGGGIFHALPVARHEPWFTPYFATPHGLDFQHAADLHDLPFEDVDVDGVGAAVTWSLDAGGVRVLRVRTDRARSMDARARRAEAVGRSVLDALG